MYIYRFLNEHNTVIYVGRTNNIIRRIRQQHFGKNGHLPDSCYLETTTVQYANVQSENDAKMYELYYIEKYHPKYNNADIGGGAFSFELHDLPWEIFEFNTDTKRHTKQELEELLNTVHQELETERCYIQTVIDRQDSVPWLSKLTHEEQNEYLRMIYMVERYTNSIGDIADKLDIHSNKKHYTDISV